jgi:capsular polysaccharide transport system ATP-binding protein
LQVLNRQSFALDFQDVVLRCSKRDTNVNTTPWNLQIRRGDKVAVMSKDRNLRDEFLGSLCGLIQPVSGQINSRCTISWPVGLKGGLEGKLTLAQNVQFLEVVYEDRVAPADPKKFFESFCLLAGLSPDQKLKSLKSKEQKLFYNIVPFIFSFDVLLVPSAEYLFKGNDDNLSQFLNQIFEKRIEKACMVTSSNNKKFLKQYCNVGLVFDALGRLVFQGPIDECFAYKKSLSSETDDSDNDDDMVDESVFSEKLSNEGPGVDFELIDLI